MKYYVKAKLVLLLFVVLLLTGCAADDPDSQVSEGLVQSETSQASVSEDTIADDGASQKDTSAEDSDQSDNWEAAGESEAQEEEAYILTFDASTIEGEAFTSDYFSDSKLTMINVWATYCNPCLSEMPDLGEIANSYDGNEFQLIGIISDVMEDAEEEEITNAKELIEETRADYPHLLLNESLYRNLVGSVSSVPTTFFVNQEGELLGYALGAQSKETWESIINDLLAETE